MAEIYEIELPDGSIVEFEGDAPPDAATQKQILAAALPKYTTNFTDTEAELIAGIEDSELAAIRKAKAGDTIKTKALGEIIVGQNGRFVSPEIEFKKIESAKAAEASSPAGALARAGILDVPSSAAFAGAFGATAQKTQALRSIPRVGPALAVGIPLVAGMGAAIGTRMGVDKLLPETGDVLSQERVARDLKEQPTAVVAGSVLSNLPFFGVGKLAPTVGKELLSRAVPAAAGAGIQAGIEAVGAPEGEILGEGAGSRIGIAALGNAALNSPTKLGEGLMELAAKKAGKRNVGTMLAKVSGKQNPTEANAAANEIALGKAGGDIAEAGDPYAPVELPRTLGADTAEIVEDDPLSDAVDLYRKRKAEVDAQRAKDEAALVASQLKDEEMAKIRSDLNLAELGLDAKESAAAMDELLAARETAEQAVNYAGAKLEPEKAALADLVGQDVEYSGYKGKLIRDEDGNFGVLQPVTDGSPNFVEIADTGKDGTKVAKDLGIKFSSKSGVVNPAVMANLGAPGIGATIGYQFGDTPEEKRQNAIYGALLASGGVLSANVAQRLAKKNPGLISKVKAGLKETLVQPETPPKQESVFESFVNQTPEAPPRSIEQPAAVDVPKSMDNPIPGYQYTPMLSKAPGGQAFKDLVGLVSTNIRTVSPRIFGDLMTYEFKLHDVKRKWAQTTVPLGQLVRKTLSKDDFEAFNLAIHNRDLEAAAAIADSYENAAEIKAALASAQQTLSDMHKVQVESGREIPILENYFPRKITDYDEFRKALDISELGVVDKVIKQARQANGGTLTEQEKEDLVNGLIEFSRSGQGKPGYLKPRTIAKLDAEMSKYYEPFDVALDNYVNRVSRDVVNREFFGKFDPSNTSEPDASIGGNIGKRVVEEMEAGRLNPKAQKIVMDNLKARFKTEVTMDDGIAKVSDGIKKATSLAFLGDVTSSIAQYSDVILNMARYGLIDTYHGYTRRKGRIKTGEIIHVPDDDLIEYSRSVKSGAFNKTVNYVLDKTIGKSDRFNKEGSLNAAWSSLKKAASNPESKAFQKLNEKYATIYGDEWTNKMLPDLAAGRLSDEARLILFTELSEIQPISRSEMPKFYNESARGRLIYALKSYWLKQLDIVRREGYEKMKHKETFMDGVGNLAAYALVVGAQGFGIDYTRDLIMGRETNPQDYFLANLMRMIGLSRYQLYKIREEGPAAAASSMAFPFGDVIKDGMTDMRAVASGEVENPIEDLESIKYLPFAGRILYWNYGKGAEKNEKRRIESLSGKKQPTTLESVKGMFVNEEKKR